MHGIGSLGILVVKPPGVLVKHGQVGQGLGITSREGVKDKGMGVFYFRASLFSGNHTSLSP